MVLELLCGCKHSRATACLLGPWVCGRQAAWALADLCGCLSSGPVASARSR